MQQLVTEMRPYNYATVCLIRPLIPVTDTLTLLKQFFLILNSINNFMDLTAHFSASCWYHFRWNSLNPFFTMACKIFSNHLNFKCYRLGCQLLSCALPYTSLLFSSFFFTSPLFLSFHTHFAFHLLLRFLITVFPLSFFLPIASLEDFCLLACHNTQLVSCPRTKSNGLMFQKAPILIFSTVISSGFKFLYSFFDFLSRLLPASICPYLTHVKPSS